MCTNKDLPHSELISKVYSNIKKSEEDDRSYLGLELKNGMKVLLVSDPSTDKSAAAISVQIGSMSDPRDFPGLAHFCEHMLFLGTEKYPVENDYNKFLHEHGGSSNAYTAMDSTCYYFNVLPDFLNETLDRFAQFFICPLFTASSTEREVNAVHSEHEKNMQIDSWRLVQLEMSTSNPNHDYNRFNTGTIETLLENPKAKGIDIRDELLKFHSKLYSANMMSLAVFGKETIEELVNIAVPIFSKVENKNLDVLEWKDSPFDEDHLKVLGSVVPVKDIKSLNISFPIPDLNAEFHTKPGSYLGHLIGHEGPGSLLSELRTLGWANTLVAGVRPGAKGFAFFILDLTLTEEGLEHANDIVMLIFQYLLMLKEEGPQEWIFEECKNLSEMTFRFKDREKAQAYTCCLANRLFLYPVEEVLTGPFLINDYNPDLINELLYRLTPDKMRIAVVGKKFESICNKIEKWYGTKYSLVPIEEELLDQWRKAEKHPNLKLPPPNEFMPSKFDLIPKESISKNPMLIRNSKMSRLWFKQDDQFGLPKASLNFEIESPMAYVDPLHFNMTHLYIQLVKDSLNEYAYAAELAGLAYNLSNTKLGIFLTIQGYNHKQHILLERIMSRLTTLKIDKKRFDILKEEMKKSLNNFRAEEPHRHAVYYTSMLISERIWTNDELLNCIDEVTAENVQQMIPRLLSRIHIEALIYGNLNEQHALDLMDIVENALKINMGSKWLMPSQWIREREVQLSNACHYVYEVENDVHRSSAVEIYYQCGIQETRTNMLLQLLVDIFSEPCFNYLRTQEQLGYIVISGIRRSNCAQGIRIVVQSDKQPSYVDGRIESFVQYFEKYLQDISDEEFQNHVQTVALLILEKPKKMAVQCAKYWLEISRRQYNFDRDTIEVDCLKTLKREEVFSFFKELVAYDAPKRKKLSVHVCSSNCTVTNERNEGEYTYMAENESSDGLIPPPPAFRPPVKIENATNFKNSLGLYPLVTPCIQLTLPFFNEKAKL